MSELNPLWRIVSTYQDGDDVVEFQGRGTRENAEKAAQAVREARADQDEGPVVIIEEVAPATTEREE